MPLHVYRSCNVFILTFTLRIRPRPLPSPQNTFKNIRVPVVAEPEGGGATGPRPKKRRSKSASFVGDVKPPAESGAKSKTYTYPKEGAKGGMHAQRGQSGQGRRGAGVGVQNLMR